jgi:hypothetical protein
MPSKEEKAVARVLAEAGEGTSGGRRGKPATAEEDGGGGRVRLGNRHLQSPCAYVWGRRPARVFFCKKRMRVKGVKVLKWRHGGLVRRVNE